MTYPALKITESQTPPTSTGWREVGQPGWQYGWLNQAVRSGVWGKLKGSQTAVLGVLLAHAGTHGHAWPKPATLAQMAGQSERSVQLAVSHLATLKLIEVRPPDEDVDKRHFTFLRCSDWVVDEHVMAATSATPAQPHAAEKAHAIALKAQPSAPQAQPSAPEAQPVAPPSIGGTQERTLSSTTPASTSPQRSVNRPPDQAGLFDDDAVIFLLTEKTFQADRARALVKTYGVDRIREALAQCDFMQAKGEVRNYPAYLTGFLTKGYTIDPRIKQEADAAKKREQNLKIIAQQKANVTPVRRLSDDARTVAAKAAKLLITLPNATQTQQREHAWNLLQAEGWGRNKFNDTIAEIDAAPSAKADRS